MELKSKLFAILAIFCVICSACAVSATDNVSYHGAYDDIRDAHDDLIIPPDANHDETAQAAGGDDFDNGIPNHGDGTDPASDDNVDNGVPFHADGTDPAEAADYVMGNSTSHAAAGNTTGNTTATQKMPATGNPILLLLGVCALVGGYTVIRRK